jgi:hypothetical protein
MSRSCPAGTGRQVIRARWASGRKIGRALRRPSGDPAMDVNTRG